MNKFELACREYLNGCSCADMAMPYQCDDCTKAFVKYIASLTEPCDNQYYWLHRKNMKVAMVWHSGGYVYFHGNEDGVLVSNLRGHLVGPVQD